MFPAMLLFVVLLNQIYAPLSLLPGGLEPDVALLAAVAAGRVYTPWGAAALGFAAGLLQETLTGGLLGVGALSKGLTGLIWTRFWNPAVSHAPLLQLPLLAGLTVFDGAIFFGCSLLFSTPTSSWDAFFPILWRQLLSNMLFGPFLLMLFAALHRRLKRPRRLSRRRHASEITFQAE
jgi:rod shape-determining protein MreD